MKVLKFKFVVTIPGLNYKTAGYKCFILTLEDLMMNCVAYMDFKGFMFEDSSRKLVAKLQYTGLKDKNGKEIFEGDVIKYCYHVDTKETHFYATIVWYNGIIEVGWEHDNILWAGFAAKGDNGEQYKGDDRYYYKEIPNIPDIEIIGNIYSNPKLLGGVK